MTRHIPDQSVLWCDNLKLNGSQSLGDWRSDFFLISIFCNVTH